MALTDKLTAIADAIRSKTGSTEKMTLVQMATEINGIQTGDGSIDTLIDGSLTEISSNVTKVHDYAFYKCSNLRTADFPIATSIGYGAFYQCSSL